MNFIINAPDSANGNENGRYACSVRRDGRGWGTVFLALPPLRTREVGTAKFARALPCGAMGTSRPTAITPAKFARVVRPPFTTPVPRGAVPLR